MTTTPGQRRWRGRRIAACLLGIASVLGAPGALAQRASTDVSPARSSDGAAAPTPAVVGTLSGRVTDARSGQGLAGAIVQIAGLRLGATTGEDGSYRIVDVPAGSHVVTARRIGYEAGRQSVTIIDGQQATADFALEAATVQLDEIIVTGTAGGEQRRAVGNAVHTIDAGLALQRSAAPDLGSLIQSRAPGVIITPNTGRIGSGPTIQIRGRSTLSLDSEPILYIDGVRVNNAVDQGPTGAGGFSGQNSEVASRLNDINPEDIESIEIIKGPAAATIYGTEAANGVIQVITKRGAQGPAQWTAKVEQGALWFRDAEGRIPTNYLTDPESGEPVGWNPIQQEEDRGTPIFSTGRTQSYNLALAGGGDLLNYYLSGTFDDDEGIEPNNSARAFNGRVNLGIVPNDELRLSTSLQYTRSSAHLGHDGGLSSMLGISIGHPLFWGDATRGFGFAPPELSQQLYDNAQDINRYTAGLTADHRPIDWFAQRVTVGIDYTSDDSRGLERFAPPELRPAFAFIGAQEADGSIGQDLRNSTFVTGDYSGTATFRLTPSLVTASSVGGQFVRKEFKESYLFGRVFPGPGVETVSGTTIKGPPTQSLIVNTTVGAYLQQQLRWNDRLYLTGAVRVDNNSAFGEDLDLVTYPKLSASWVISEEPFWEPFGDVVGTLKLRTAYGQSGQQPDAFSALRTVVNAPRANGTPGVTPGTIGNADLKPERGTELEMGFEAGLLERLSLDFTYFTKRTKDAILERDLAPSSGFAGEQIVNIGETTNRGIELYASFQAITRESVAWEIAGNISTNRDRIEDMGGVSPGTAIQRNAEGYPIDGFWTKRIASADRDPVTHAVTNILCVNGPDGAPAPCGQALAVFVGTPTPKLLGAIANTVTIGGRLRLYGLVDFKRGHKLINSNDNNRCAFGMCEAIHFPERYSTAYLAGIAPSSQTAGVLDHVIQDASFVKLRELSASYELPDQWLGRAGITGATLSVAGRNLATWSDYNGIDPEVGLGGALDQGLTPPLTQFVTTLSLRF